MLDEPTNHLDVEGVAWLAGHLRARREALVVVTHDRWFLDEVCEQTWEVGDGTVRRYDGGYAAYVLARAERARQAAASEARRQNLLRKEMAWLRRGPPARTTKPRFRIEAANALIADVPPPRDSTRLQAFAAARLGKQVYDVEDVTLAVGDRTLLDHVTWRVGPGDRVAVVGVNGAGKTTLLRLLLGDRHPDGGTVRVGQTVRAGFLSQDGADLRRAARTAAAAGGGRAGRPDRPTSAGSSCPPPSWPSGSASAPAGSGPRSPTCPAASGAGCSCCGCSMAEPNVLLLDEPTNDLDTDTLAALEDLLDTWPGTLVVVSHDRYLVERVCDTVVALLGDGSLAALPGGVDEYLARRRAARRGHRRAVGGPPGPGRHQGRAPAPPAAS